jgi:regulatory protein
MSNYSEALAHAAAFCSASEHCISEVLDKTKKFELSQEDQDKLIRRLQEEGFLDEKRYVKAFVNDKFRFSKWGRIKIRYRLRQKGVSSDLTEEGLGIISEKDYQETLTSMLLQKKRSVKAASKYEYWGKMMRFAISKGFEPSIASDCLKEIGINDNEDE